MKSGCFSQPSLHFLPGAIIVFSAGIVEVRADVFNQAIAVFSSGIMELSTVVSCQATDAFSVGIAGL